MDKQRQDDQLEPTYSSFVSIRDAVQKTCWKQWLKRRGGERGSGISVMMVWYDDDDIYVEMIDCSESDSMIEICGKLDKSNT